MTNGAPHAAVDLGSNSFHLLVVEGRGRQLIERDRLKQKVQLLAGFSDGLMQPQAIQRGLSCLAGFAQRLAGVPPGNICVMGTSALRQARNQEEFTRQAEALLGVPVTVISGEEEARLIDVGVAGHLEPPLPEEGEVSRLVVDIGGGSTEFALSTNAHSARQLRAAQSLALGCVSFTDRFFSPVELGPARYAEARAAAVALLRDAGLGPNQATQVIGTSGSIESVQGVLQVNGWSEQCIDVEGLRELEAAMGDRRWVNEVGLPGLAPERVDIFPAGLAILSAVFEVLQIRRMRYVGASLMHGMLQDGEPFEGSLQARTVADVAARFGVDQGQAARVGAQLERLVAQAAAGGWPLSSDTRRCMQWAAQLHEVGMALSASSYHRHGAYILSNLRLPGFSSVEQGDLALLVRGHRRSLPALAYRALPEDRRLDVLLAIVLLRLAVILERGHDDSRSPAALELAIDGEVFDLRLPREWLEENVLSARELDVEARQLEGVQLKLSVSSL